MRTALLSLSSRLGIAEHPSDRALHVALALFLMTAAFIVTKTGRDALVLQERGLLQLPAIYVGMAMASGPLAMGALGLMRRFGPRRVRIVVPVAVATLLALFYPFAMPGGGLVNSVFFAFVPLAWGIMFSLAWLLAADLLDGCTPTILAPNFAFIGAASITGGLAGGLGARLVSDFCAPNDLLAFGAITLLVAAITMFYTQRIFPARIVVVERSDETRAMRVRIQRVIGSARRGQWGSLLVIAILASIVGVFVEFQFYMAASTAGNTGQENVDFFSTVYALLNGAALVVQLVIMPRLQRSAGVGGSLLVLPVAVLVGGTALLVGTATLLTRSALRLTEGGLKASIHRSNWEQAYLAIRPRERSTLKLLIDGMGVRFGEATAALVLLGWAHFYVGEKSLVGLNIQWISWAIVVTTFAWLAMTLRLRRQRDDDATALGTASLFAAVPIPDS